MVISGNGIKFIIALKDSGEEMTWNEAMYRYNKYLPDKSQAEILINQYVSINNAIIAFGGDTDPRCSYWTKTECDTTSAYMAYMFSGYIGNYPKTDTYKVRTVIPFEN